MGKNTIFLSPINFLTSFSVTSRKKNWTRGENIILFLIKLISKKLSRRKGKINTIQHGQGEKKTKNIFPQNTARESRTINCMAQEEKNEDTRGKNKDTGGKIKTGEKNIIYFPPVEILSSDIVTKKDIVQREKYDLISLLQYFPPSTQSVRVEKLLHGLKGKK